jgi:hypothetical protein
MRCAPARPSAPVEQPARAVARVERQLTARSDGVIGQFCGTSQDAKLTVRSQAALQQPVAALRVRTL